MKSIKIVIPAPSFSFFIEYKKVQFKKFSYLTFQIFKIELLFSSNLELFTKFSILNGNKI